MGLYHRFIIFYLKIVYNLGFDIGQQNNADQREEDSSSANDQNSGASFNDKISDDAKLWRAAKPRKPQPILDQKKASKLRLMNSLIKILRILENGKQLIIWALVYLDKLTISGEIIQPADIHR